MPVNCCVPLCTQHGRLDKSGQKVTYHRFPRDPELRKKWIVAIRRDEGTFFTVSNATKVCSHHFLETDFLANVANGYRHLHHCAVPSIFPFCKTKTSRKPPREREPPPATHRKRRRQDITDEENLVEEIAAQRVQVPERQCNEECDVPSGGEQADPHCNGDDEMPTDENFTATLDSSCACGEVIAQLRQELAASRASEMATKVELERLQEQLKSQTSEIHLLRSELAIAQAENQELEQVTPFGIAKFKGDDDDIQFYTGLPSYGHFCTLLSFLDPGENGKNIIRNEGTRRSEQSGRPQKVSVENQLFLVLVKLRLGLFHKHLGTLFGISISTVSRIFSTWIDFMYWQLAQLPLWLSREAVDEAMPPDFRCTSDKECVIRSGLLELPFETGDSVMADKGFKIDDLLQSKGVGLNILPFLRKDQFTPEVVQETQNIAALRIHVERRIQRIKGFHIFGRSIPISLAPLANQVWTVCAILTNFQSPLMKDCCD
ncbi:uncharacterized protein LOC135371725 [Ornithodoros turicata]|uniref:uncharacterized protein LOC135371725 n=1 Tax=Ornithodoros turicata TaxID=34597 RepID=UPI003139CF2B